MQKKGLAHLSAPTEKITGTQRVNQFIINKMYGQWHYDSHFVIFIVLRNKRKTFVRRPTKVNLTPSEQVKSLSSTKTAEITQLPHIRYTENRLTPLDESIITSFNYIPRQENFTVESSLNISLKDDLDLLEMFEEGIPCRSKLLSTTIRELQPVANRSSEVLVAYCKVS